MIKTKVIQTADASHYFTVDEAATILGIKPTAIRNYLTWGKMLACKFKTLTLISREEIERWKDRQK